MSQSAEPPRPTSRPGRFWMRAGLLASVVGMVLVIWASHFYLTRSFSEDQSADSTVRATLYAGTIQSAMQRHSVIPQLLARDPILILALQGRRVRRRRGSGWRPSARRSASARSSCSTPTAEVVAASDDTARAVRRARPSPAPRRTPAASR